ncbi:MAG TPA: hypothetical protein P5514_13785 [Bacteroidales bacterium]|nr:hypothetical protein [Bacteroidales bacterium]HPE56111.1 hypothetical protein [Bacteroidales bacterium]HRX98014.1 hypothetical protein [Bacteroidales bacterium]
MLVQLLRTILIILIAYYLIKFFMRYVAPFILRYFVRKAQMQHQNTSSNRSHQGDMHIEYNEQHKGNKSSLGEYVDYEEVTEEKSNNHHHA